MGEAHTQKKLDRFVVTSLPKSTTHEPTLCFHAELSNLTGFKRTAITTEKIQDVGYVR
jgi:hypothetical protein